jgi:glutathione S-transferase
MTLKLCYTPGACSLSPHIALREAGLPSRLVKVDLAAKKLADGGDFFAINRKGYVPALSLDDGQVLTEYIVDLAPDARLAPKPGTFARVRLNEWLHFIATELHKGFGPINNPKAGPELKQFFRQRLDSRFQILASALEGREYLDGSSFSIADGYAYYTLRNLRRLDAAALEQSAVLRPYYSDRSTGERVHRERVVAAASRAHSPGRDGGSAPARPHGGCARRRCTRVDGRGDRGESHARLSVRDPRRTSPGRCARRAACRDAANHFARSETGPAHAGKRARWTLVLAGGCMAIQGCHVPEARRLTRRECEVAGLVVRFRPAQRHLPASGVRASGLAGVQRVPLAGGRAAADAGLEPGAVRGEPAGDLAGHGRHAVRRAGGGLWALGCHSCWGRRTGSSRRPTCAGRARCSSPRCRTWWCCSRASCSEASCSMLSACEGSGSACSRRSRLVPPTRAESTGPSCRRSLQRPPALEPCRARARVPQTESGAASTRARRAAWRVAG